MVSTRFELFLKKFNFRQNLVEKVKDFQKFPQISEILAIFAITWQNEYETSNCQ